MKKTLLYTASALVLLAIVVSGLSSPIPRADAFLQPPITSGPLNGWGWSDTIGWISFNCLTGSPTGGSICGTSSYSVQVDESGNLSGYAWSDNIGWIKFGGLAGFPAGGSSSSNAKLDTVTGKINGWAQALSGAGRTDGWDGWISLSGVSADSSVYGIATSFDGLFSGYAWGSDVIGWLTFNTFGANNPCDPTKQVCMSEQVTPTVTLIVSPTSIATGTTATLSWTTTNIATCSNITGSTGTSGWNGAVSATSSGSHSVGSFSTPTSVTYTLNCTASVAAGGGPVSASAILLVTGSGGNGGTSFCAPVSNATLCTGEGSSTPVSGTTIVGSQSMCADPGLPTTASLCQYYCNTGFRQLGKTCVLNSTIQEN